MNTTFRRLFAMTLALAAALCGSARAQAPLPPEVAHALRRAQVPESALALLIEPVSAPQAMPASSVVLVSIRLYFFVEFQHVLGSDVRAGDIEEINHGHFNAA